jgi:hypothetical protein
VFLFSQQMDRYVPQGGQDPGGVTPANPAAIFPERFIPRVVQAVLDSPMCPDQVEQSLGTGFVPRQAGDPVDDFGADLPLLRPGSFQTEHLLHTRPVT